MSTITVTDIRNMNGPDIAAMLMDMLETREKLEQAEIAAKAFHDLYTDAYMGWKKAATERELAKEFALSLWADNNEWFEPAWNKALEEAT